MIITVGIYHSRYTGITISSSDMVAASPDKYALINTVDIDIGDPVEYDWAAHDERAKSRRIAELKQKIEKLEGKVKPSADMSDWRNWKVGDFVTCFGIWQGRLTRAKPYKLKSCDAHSLTVLSDDTGKECTWITSNFRWHSRPSA